MSKLFIGADHAGYKLKEKITEYLKQQGIEFEDLGNYTYEKTDDYPIYGHKVAAAVSRHRDAKGILICGSSFGVCIVANKVKGIRAVPVANAKQAQLSREHNDANILCLSGWETSFPQAKKIILTWLKTKKSPAKRHIRRITQIKKIEQKNFK